jgi:tetratricopeptide (TPR) repeat protein
MMGYALATLLAFATAEPVAASAVASAAPPPRPEQLLAIPDDLRAQFRDYLATHGAQLAPRIEHVVGFLFQPDGLGMVYERDATYTVAEAYRTRTANCLTFTLLTVALARHAGLNAYGQQIAKSLAWRREGNMIYRTIHVNAGVVVSRRRVSVDVAWDQVITGDPPEKISDARLFAHYYNNRSVELMAAGQLQSALRHAELSLALDRDYATSWSNAGVLQLRAGQPELAERDYQHALELEPRHTGALINLGTYYQRRGDAARAAPLLKRLETVQKRDPLHQFILALDYEKRGEFREAVAHYQRAIRLYDGEHRFYAGLARVYAQLGNTRRSDRALQRAQQLTDIASGKQERTFSGQPLVPRELLEGAR